MKKSKYKTITLSLKHEDYHQAEKFKAMLEQETGLHWTWTNLLRDALNQYKKSTANALQGNQLIDRCVEV
jgi:hypothetical protein